MAVPRPRSVLFAGPFDLLCAGLAALCESTGRYHALGRCVDGQEALAVAAERRPDLCVLDADLRGLPVAELLLRLRRLSPHMRLVALTPRPNRDLLVAYLRGHIDALVARHAPTDEFLQALDATLAHRRHLSACLAEPGLLHAEQDPLHALSAREQQVFALLVEGIRAKEIAARLELSPKTVDTHRASLMRKLDIHDVAGLVKLAIRRDLAAAL